MNNIYKFPQRQTEFMLLSYKKLATASTSKSSHEPCYALDCNEKTFWSSKSGMPGEWLCVDLGAVKSVYTVRLGCFSKGTLPTVLGSVDGKSFEVIFDSGKNTVPFDGIIAFEKGLRLRFLKLEFLSPCGDCFSVNDFRVFGFGNGSVPQKVENPFGVRTSKNEAVVHWNKVSTAVGYKIRYGTSPQQLNNNTLIYGADCISLDSLTEEQTEYYYAVDSFNENGVTMGDINRIGSSAAPKLYKI